jgi:hypothetical protein
MIISLATRPVLFALVRALGEAWPADVSREGLVARAFRGKHADESHRARLRVEIGRLRVELHCLAEVSATKRGFALAPRGGREIVVLAPTVEDGHAAVLALLAEVKLGRARPWRSRLEQDLAPSNGRLSNSPATPRCNDTVVGGRVVG